MLSTPRRNRAARLTAGALALLAVAGCGGGGHAATPTTTLLEADHWEAPLVSGPPSSRNFCTLLVAMYSHEADLPIASEAVKKLVLSDFVATVPEALRNAPAGILPAAQTYLGRLAAVLSALVRADLDYKKVPAGTLTPLLLDPSTKAAGNQVLDYSRTVCHYTIGGTPAQP